MAKRRLVIGGTGSGVGKTTVTLGLMSALMKKGYIVQGFKCGPDYIDPAYHTAVTGRPSRNLDSWMLRHETVKEIYARGSEGADISIIEGVMGFYDGKDPRTNAGSTAEISEIIQSPVLLVVNCASMARSVAAVVKGFQLLSDGPNIIGVLANKVGSEGHYKLVKTAIEQECGIPVIGYLKREADMEIPERHLGLVPSIERGELDPFFDRLGTRFLETIDLGTLWEISQASEVIIDPSCSLFEPKKEVKCLREEDSKKEDSKKVDLKVVDSIAVDSKEGVSSEAVSDELKVRIAVAKDAAFNFYYPENLELLEQAGAQLVYFSPVKGETLPADVDGLYLGGGFPEEFVHQLAAGEQVKASIREAIQNGVPTFAECGGFMYLTKSIETTDKREYDMIGIIPGKVTMQTRLTALGYREVHGQKGNFLFGNLLIGDQEEITARGHEFHYSTFHAERELAYAYETKGMRGAKREGYMTPSLVAGYTHLHFASNPVLVDHWIQACKIWRETKT